MAFVFVFLEKNTNFALRTITVRPIEASFIHIVFYLTFYYSSMLSRRFNIKMLASAVVLVMTLCVSAFAGLKSGSWSLNPADFRFDMSLYFSLADRSLEDLDTYEIGAFVDDECRGIAEVLDLGDAGSCLYMRIRSNSAQGAQVEFRIRRIGSDEFTVLKPGDGTDFIFKSDDRVGMPSAPYLLARFYSVEITAGEHGTVDFKNGLYREGTELSVKAVPDSGFRFVGWSDGSVEADRTITVSEDITLIASFIGDVYKVVFYIDGEEFSSIDVAVGSEIEVPEAPERLGYVFDGWGEIPSTMPAEDLEFHGSYSPGLYKAMFYIDGEEFASVDVPFGSPIEAPEAPVRQGYVFSGWGDIPSTMPAENLEFHATYSAAVYKAVFYIDGEVFSSIDVPFGGLIIAPEAPVRLGYVFDGWGEIPPTMPAEDLEFNGTYSPAIYKAVFKVDGEEIASYELAYDAPLVAPDVEEKEGYTFNGWGELPATMPAHDLEMHSSYTVNVYSLVFTIDGEVLASYEVPFGASIIAPEAPARDGYNFDGWGDVPEFMPARDLAFEGSYDAIEYNVTYKIDGEVAFTALAEYGSPVPEFEAPVKEGYVFSGWSEIPAEMPAHDIEVNGSYAVGIFSIVFRIGDEVVASQDLPYGAEIVAPEAPQKEGYSFGGWSGYPAVMPAEDLVIIGDYSVNTYRVTYIIDNEEYASQSYEFGADIVVPEVPDKEGHTFSGWGDVPQTMPAFDLVLGGTYADIFYTVTFRIDGVVIYTDDVAFESPISVPDVPEKEGHTFNGWGEVPAVMPACNLDFEGSYAVNRYMLTFRIDDDVIFGGEIPYGSEIVLPDAPAKDGYSFSGWGVVPSLMPASDLEFTGAYEPNSYALTFMLDGDVYFMTQLPVGSRITAPEDPVREGHTFTGWSELPETMPANDLTVTGGFTVDSYSLTFRIGDEVIATGQLNYGAEITVPDAPAVEGHSFAGWGVVPATMPASDLVIEGAYDVNVYTLTYDIDGEVYYVTQLAYGTEITAPTEVPEKDGHSFQGWGCVPPAMPAFDLTVSGTYSINHYTLTFLIGEEVIFTGEQPYGSNIVVPEVPAREGHSFSGWGDVPATMPMRSLEFVGNYEINSYTLVFRIEDQVVFTGELSYGSEIIVPEAPEKEGHTFTGWGVVPAVMPASDLEITGSYDVDVYNVVFRIGDEVVFSDKLAYGSEIPVPAAPEKEGYMFCGWSDVPSSMPGHDVEVIGRYDVISYKVSFEIDGEVIAEMMVPYGSDIMVPEAPDKEGHTFTGWGVVPTVMPAADLTFTGSYELNYYTLTVKLDGKVFYSTLLPYGADILLPEPEVGDGQLFEGWEGEVPATMPAHDVEVNGKVSHGSAVTVHPSDMDAFVDVLDLNGIVIRRSVKAAEAIDGLTPGIYIIGDRKTVVR